MPFLLSALGRKDPSFPLHLPNNLVNKVRTVLISHTVKFRMILSPIFTQPMKTGREIWVQLSSSKSRACFCCASFVGSIHGLSLCHVLAPSPSDTLWCWAYLPNLGEAHFMRRCTYFVDCIILTWFIIAFQRRYGGATSWFSEGSVIIWLLCWVD